MGCCLSLACCACEGACCLGRGLCACCPSSGDDGKKAANPDAGRTGSMWVMVLAMALSLLMQYYVAKYMDFYAWTCDDDDAGCKGAAAVSRGVERRARFRPTVSPFVGLPRVALHLPLLRGHGRGHLRVPGLPR